MKPLILLGAHCRRCDFPTGSASYEGGVQGKLKKVQ
jgi:hypothetical protein